jgi:hypothetical protein
MTARTDSVDATGWEYETVPTDDGIIHIVSGGLARDQGDVTLIARRLEAAGNGDWLISPDGTILAHRLGAAGLSGARWRCSIIRPRGGGLTFRYVCGSGPGILPPCSIVANGCAGTGEPEKGFYRTLPIIRHGMRIGEIIVDDNGDGFTVAGAAMTFGERLDRAVRHWSHIVTRRPWTFADRIIIKRSVADPIPVGHTPVVTASTALVLVRADLYALRFNERRYMDIDGNARIDVVNEIARTFPDATAAMVNGAIADLDPAAASAMLARIRELER